jgi:hypothetical protein
MPIALLQIKIIHGKQLVVVVEKVGSNGVIGKVSSLYSDIYADAHGYERIKNPSVCLGLTQGATILALP